MASEGTDTREALMEAAGALFADYGLDGATVRAIAEKGGANIAAVNYYFGGKENLYTEVLRFVVTQIRCTLAREYLAAGTCFNTAAGRVSAIRALVRERFKAYCSYDRPAWYGRLMMRSMLEPNPSLRMVVEEMLQPENEALKQFLRRCKPSLSDWEAQLWAFSIAGQVSFYVFSEAPVLTVLGKQQYDTDFLDEAAEHVSRAIIDGLGLRTDPEGAR